VFPSPTSGDKSTLLALVKSRRSKLRELRMCYFDHSAPENEQLQAVLQGLSTASCRLRQLELGYTIADAQLDALLNALPKFRRLKCISFTMKSDQQWKAKVLSAFRHNFSLVKSKLLNDHHWSSKERSLLQAYRQRNRNLGNVLRSECMARKFGNAGSLLPSLLFVSVRGSSSKGVTRAFRALYQVDDQVGPISRPSKRTRPMDNSGQGVAATEPRAPIANMQ
jgi:hypothetical protein